MDGAENQGIAWFSPDRDPMPGRGRVPNRGRVSGAEEPWRVPISVAVFSIIFASLRVFAALGILWITFGSSGSYTGDFFGRGLSTAEKTSIFLVEWVALVASIGQIYAFSIRHTFRIWWTTVLAIVGYGGQVAAALTLGVYSIGPGYASFYAGVCVIVLAMIYRYRTDTDALDLAVS